MAFLHEEEDDHNHKDEKKEYGAKDRYSSEKAHLTGEFVIVAKFGGHALRHLASRLANVIRQEGRQTKNLQYFKNPYLRWQGTVFVWLHCEFFYSLKHTSYCN